jgi:hypothetical protein
VAPAYDKLAKGEQIARIQIEIDGALQLFSLTWGGFPIPVRASKHDPQPGNIELGKVLI